MRQNYYIAKIFARRCMVDIRINDVPLMKGKVDGDATVQRPINHLVETSGIQKLTAAIFPILEDSILPKGVRCIIEIWKCDGSGHKLIPMYVVCSLSLGNDDKASFPMLTEGSKVFTVEVDYQIERWNGCERLSAGRELNQMVVAFYKNVANLLMTKQFDEYAQLINQRENNICRAMYLGEEEIERRKSMLIDCLDNNFDLLPLAGHKKLQYYADRRLVSIINDDMKSALQFLNHETGEILSVDLMLGFRKGEKKLSLI